MPKRIFVLSLTLLLCVAVFGEPSLKPKTVAAFTSISVYGAWHCGNEFCSWATVRNMTDFDNRNRWLINRGDGSPSVNLVVLSFVQPLKLLNKT
ncbi:MAG TPA: hypothetical protein VJM50_12680, partial [Pyrinomonadaceae bacterium]|nr:hypothetical protein [Pyrinomonadaceae bacterium]